MKEHSFPATPREGGKLQPDAACISGAVCAYNKAYGMTDANVWNFVRERGEDMSAWDQRDVEEFVWKVRIWGRIQGGTRPTAAAAAAARVIRGLDRRSPPQGKEELILLWSKMVCAMFLAGGRREFSWASKILHWMFPGLAPAYDCNVIRVVCPGEEGLPAYEKIVDWAWERVQHLACLPMALRDRVVGSEEPRTLIRALDKYAWLKGRKAGRKRQGCSVR